MDTTKSESNEASMLHLNNNLKCYNATTKVYGTQDQRQQHNDNKNACLVEKYIRQNAKEKYLASPLHKDRRHAKLNEKE